MKNSISGIKPLLVSGCSAGADKDEKWLRNRGKRASNRPELLYFG